ncbi:MAG: HAD-IA family hydrolase [Pseudomonadales bacterium]
MGVLKPHPRLFQTLLDLLDLAPQRALYIDDEPASVAAAAAFGMRAWRFRSAPELAESLARHGWLQ